MGLMSTRTAGWPVLALAAAVTTSSALAAQPSEPLASGHWRPARSAAAVGDLALSIHRSSDGAYHGLAARGEQAWPARNISVVNGKISLVVPAIEATFTGQWDDTARQWRGGWSEAGRTTVVNLTKGAPPRFTSSSDPYAKPQRLIVLPDGRWMNLYCLGQGSPTVILDSGIGGGMSDWARVHKDLSKTTRVCAYDRAGYGFSDPGPMPRESAAIATDLADLLKGAGVRGPYVLVGHSAGSLNVRLFANWRFDDVAGMVLVDPSGDFQQTRFAAAAPGLAQEAQPSRPDRLAACLDVARRGLLAKDSDLYRSCRENDPARLETPGAEGSALNSSSSAQNLVTQRKYGDLPMVVLTRDKAPRPGFSDADVSAHYAVWTQIHDELAGLSQKGVRRMIPGAGHYIQNDKPQAVIDAVNEVVAAARQSRRANSVVQALPFRRRT